MSHRRLTDASPTQPCTALASAAAVTRRTSNARETAVSDGLRTTKVLAIGLGALLAPVLLSGAATADPGGHPDNGIAPIPPVAPVEAVVLARGAAGEFDVDDEGTGVHLQATESTDVVMVKATVAPHSSTGWHTHAGPSMAVGASGAGGVLAPPPPPGWQAETFPAAGAFRQPAG